MILSHRKARAYSFTLFFSGLAILTYFNLVWPWVLLLIGIVLGLKSFFLGKVYEGLMNLFIFLGLTIGYLYKLSWGIAIPIILVIASIFEIYKSYKDEVDLTIDETIEDKKHEIEEDQ